MWHIQRLITGLAACVSLIDPSLGSRASGKDCGNGSEFVPAYVERLANCAN